MSGAGTLAFLWLTPTAASGCALLHLVSYGPPDGGTATTGTFTVDSAASAVQANTYGPDVYVNVADGSDCGSIGGCIDFSDPSVCDPTTTATPTETPTTVPTATLPATSGQVAETPTATPRQRRR